MALSKRGILTLKWPVEPDGNISSWDDWEKLVHNSFYNDLRCAPEENMCILVENLRLSKGTREKMVQILFETFNVPCLLLANSASLTAYYYQKLTGIVIESGEGNTQIVPIYEGYAIYHAAKFFPITGKKLTDFLIQSLEMKGFSITTSSERDIVKSAKESFCYVSQNLERDEILAQEAPDIIQKQFEFPDGQIGFIDTETYRCPEAMFNPSLLQLGIEGIQEFVKIAIEESPEEIREALYANIMLGGGNTCFPGFPERLEKEVAQLTSYKVKVHANASRAFSSSLGASALSSTASYQNLFITKEEYDEIGPKIHRKCVF